MLRDCPAGSSAAAASRQAVGRSSSQSSLPASTQTASQPLASHAVLQATTESDLWANSAVRALLDGTEKLTNQSDDLLPRQLECMQPPPAGDCPVTVFIGSAVWESRSALASTVARSTGLSRPCCVSQVIIGQYFKVLK